MQDQGGRYKQRPGVGATVVALSCLGFFAISIPVVVMIVTSFNATPDLNFPPSGVSLKWYLNVFKRTAFLRSCQLSFVLAALTSIVSLVLGFLSSLGLVRYKFIGRDILHSILLIPLIVPEVVIGCSLLILFNKLHQYNSIINILILHIILVLPYSINVISANLVRFDMTLEEAAMSLKANKITTFWLITVPMIKEGLIASAIFSFVISFNNFTATVFLVRTKSTLPVEIFSYIRTESDPTVCCISTLLFCFVVIVILVAERLVGMEKLAK